MGFVGAGVHHTLDDDVETDIAFVKAEHGGMGFGAPPTLGRCFASVDEMAK